jgi:hypothetical protein
MKNPARGDDELALLAYYITLLYAWMSSFLASSSLAALQVDQIGFWSYHSINMQCSHFLIVHKSHNQKETRWRWMHWQSIILVHYTITVS